MRVPRLKRLKHTDVADSVSFEKQMLLGTDACTGETSSRTWSPRSVMRTLACFVWEPARAGQGQDASVVLQHLRPRAREECARACIAVCDALTSFGLLRLEWTCHLNSSPLCRSAFSAVARVKNKRPSTRAELARFCVSPTLRPSANMAVTVKQLQQIFAETVADMGPDSGPGGAVTAVAGTTRIIRDSSANSSQMQLKRRQLSSRERGKSEPSWEYVVTWRP